MPPAEIEAILIQHPKIIDAAVIGIPDKESGELPRAFIVKAPNTDLTEQEVVKYVDGKYFSAGLLNLLKCRGFLLSTSIDSDQG